MKVHVFILLVWLGLSLEHLIRQLNDPESGAVRRKRIVYGTDLTDRNSYGLMSYVVFISHGHHCEAIDPVMEAEYKRVWGIKDRANNFELLQFYIYKQINLHFLCEPLQADFLHCGGVLLTEFVVQTACHCVANLLKENRTYSRPVKNSLWEYPFGLYMNEYIVSKMRHGVRAKYITHHSKCASYFGEITHDYGLIFTRDSMFKKEWKFVKPAPVYTMTEMARFWQQTMREENVCLFVGYGSYRYFKTGVYGPAAPELQHSWRFHMSYYDCYLSTFQRSVLRSITNLHDMTYLDLGTWSCSLSFGKNVGYGAPGDSGSPVTCNEQYYGMHTGGIPLYHLVNATRRNLSVFHGVTQAIAFSVWENSAEYRNQLNFLAGHFHYAKQYEVPTFRPISKSGSPVHFIVFPLLFLFLITIELL